MFNVRPQTESEERSNGCHNASSRPEGAIERGDGFESTSGVGWFRDRSFTPQSALLFSTELGIELKIYDQQYDCASALSAVSEPHGRSVDVTISKDPAAASSLPIGQPVAGAEGGYTEQLPHNRSESFSTSDTRLVLTRIDTSLGGYWHGRLSLSQSPGEGQSPYSFSGAFSARWCAG